MSVKVMGLVWDLDLKPTLKFVLLAYADHANHSGGNIYPAIETVARKTGFSSRTIQNATRELEKMGLLLSEGSSDKGTNRWTIPLDMGGESPAPPHVGDESLSIRGESPAPGGVNLLPKRGESPAPEPLINHHINREGNGKNDFPPPDKPIPQNHPAIKIFREVMGAWPEKEARPLIVELVGDSTKEQNRWRQMLVDWKMRGYRKANIAGILDAFAAGGLGKGKEIANDDVSGAKAWMMEVFGDLPETRRR